MDNSWDDDEESPPVRVSLYPEWTEEAVCAGQSDTLFFGASDPNKRPQYTVTDIKRARRLCASCPVAKECLKSSLDHNDEFGVFAGSTRANRVDIRKRIASGVTTQEEEIVSFLTWLKEGFGV